jgi:hypothetical protein
MSGTTDAAGSPMQTPFILAPMTDKRIVLDHGNGVSQILGTTAEQPADLVTTGDGRQWCLVGCRRGRAYHYKPLMAPSDTMQKFHDNQR